MRFALTGGENCPTATVARFRRRWDHLSVAIGYGLTEAGVITWIRDEELDAHPDSVGRSFGAQTFRVVDAEGHPVPAGVTGEVVTAAPVVTSGYWNAPTSPTPPSAEAGSGPVTSAGWTTTTTCTSPVARRT